MKQGPPSESTIPLKHPLPISRRLCDPSEPFEHSSRSTTTRNPLNCHSNSKPQLNPQSKMADTNARCAKTFKHFVEVAAVGQSLTEADKKEIKIAGICKLLKECCDETVAKASEAQVFPKYCDKKTKKLKLDVFLGDFLNELAATVIQNRKKLSRRPDLADPEVVTMADEMRGQIAAKSDIKTKEMKVDAVTARLTNTKSYTGTHKERFSEDGKGKGVAGRKDIVDKSGYVTGFKGHGSGSSGK